MAEEIGHHFTSSGEPVVKRRFSSSDRLTIDKIEYKALRWAANYLVPENSLLDALRDGLCEVWELAEEFRAYSNRGGQVFVSTHSPDFLNAAKLDEVFWLEKKNGYTQIKRASDDIQIKAYMNEGDQMGFLWKQGFFGDIDPE